MQPCFLRPPPRQLSRVKIGRKILFSGSAKHARSHLEYFFTRLHHLSYTLPYFTLSNAPLSLLCVPVSDATTLRPQQLICCPSRSPHFARAVFAPQPGFEFGLSEAFFLCPFWILITQGCSHLIKHDLQMRIINSCPVFPLEDNEESARLCGNFHPLKVYASP